MVVKVVAVVAIVAVVAAGIIIIALPKGENSEYNPTPVDSPLLVRGNADENYVIDSNDMKVVDDVIAKKKTLEDYPFADVNNDGSVDDTDKKILQDMIDRKEGTTIYIQALGVDGKDTTVQVKYPLRNVVTYASNMEMATNYAGGGEFVAGYFTKSYKNAESSVASSAVDLKGSARQIKDEAWANFTNLDATLTAQGKSIGALLVDFSGIAQMTEARVQDLNEAGIPLIIYKPADSLSETSAVVTLSYLFGVKTEKIGQEYAKLWDKVTGYLQEKLGNLADEGKSTYISFNMYIYICQNDSTFNSTPATAYGLPYYKTNNEFAEKYKGTGSSKMTTTEALANYTNVNKLINNRSNDWVADEAAAKAAIVETWEHDNSGTPSTEYFKGFDNKLYYVNNLLPGPVKLAYVASCLYDSITTEWADGIFNDAVKIGLLPLQGQTPVTTLACFDYEDYQKAKA
jgi:hypothetical protein